MSQNGWQSFRPCERGTKGRERHRNIMFSGFGHCGGLGLCFFVLRMAVSLIDLHFRILPCMPGKLVWQEFDDSEGLEDEKKKQKKKRSLEEQVLGFGVCYLFWGMSDDYCVPRFQNR